MILASYLVVVVVEGGIYHREQFFGTTKVRNKVARRQSPIKVPNKVTQQSSPTKLPDKVAQQSCPAMLRIKDTR